MMSCAYHDPDLLGEPTLDELLAEPMIQQFMERDGIKEDDMRSEFDRVRKSYGLLVYVQ